MRNIKLPFWGASKNKNGNVVFDTLYSWFLLLQNKRVNDRAAGTAYLKETDGSKFIPHLTVLSGHKKSVHVDEKFSPRQEHLNHRTL